MSNQYLRCTLPRFAEGLIGRSQIAISCPLYPRMQIWIGTIGMSALGQKQTYAVHKAMSALPPIATAKADSRKWSCPLYPPKADMCGALVHVR